MSLDSFKLRLNTEVKSQPSYTEQTPGETYVRLTQTFLNRYFQGKPPAELVVVVSKPEPPEESGGRR